MFKIIGKIKGKTLISEGTSVYGKWRIMRFMIEKQYNKKKRKFVFTAKGRMAELAFKIPTDEKVIIHFFPDCVQMPNGKWYTEMIVEEIDKYIPKNQRYQTVFNGEIVDEPDIEFKEDLQLFKKNDYEIQNPNESAKKGN